MKDFHPIERLVRRLLAAVSLAILLAMIALHFGLVDLGEWGVDEFCVFSSYRDMGWTAFVDRLIGWSPRPISEVLIWAYACLVNWIHKPLIGVCLGLLWLTLISAPLISFLQIRRTFSEDSRRPLLFLSLFAFTPITLFLLCHDPRELFYWPVGAAAYLTTLSAITLCFFQLAFSLTEDHLGRVITSVSLIVAAGSSETGAAFAVAFSCLSLTGTTVDAFRGSSSQGKIFWHLVPALLGICVFGLLMRHRLPNQEVVFSSAEYHSLYPSLKAALGQMFKEYLVADDQHPSTRRVLLALLLKTCIFMAIRYCWLSGGIKIRRRQLLVVFALSIITTTYFSFAASYYAFGGPTYDRHDELRQCLIILFIATVALWSCHYRASICGIRNLEWRAVIFVFITLISAVPGRFMALRHDYRSYSVCIQSRIRSWNSGLSDGNTMIWSSPPQGQVVGKLEIEPGMYTLKSKLPICVGMMQFFRKERLEVRP